MLKDSLYFIGVSSKLMKLYVTWAGYFLNRSVLLFKFTLNKLSNFFKTWNCHVVFAFIQQFILCNFDKFSQFINIICLLRIKKTDKKKNIFSIFMANFQINAKRKMWMFFIRQTCVHVFITNQTQISSAVIFYLNYLKLSYGASKMHK